MGRSPGGTKMKRKTGIFAAILLLFCPASAGPLLQADDLTGKIVIPYDAETPSAGSFTFSFRYPCIDESEEDAAVINSFYREQMEMDETNMQFFADGYAEMGKNAVKDVSYRITCNSDDYFSVLIIQNLTVGGATRIIWDGQTFSRKRGEIGATFDLPRLLGILDESEQDEYMIERQAGKASDIVLELIMDQIYDNPDDIPYFDEVDYDYLHDFIFPQEDFYLDENEDPVFYAAPGTIADDSAGYVIFHVPLQDITDEL